MGAESNPKITFASTRLTARGGERFEVAGDVTMNGVTKPIVLAAEIGDPITDPWGLTWNQILEAGALLVPEEFKLSIDVQATQRG